nr:flagellar hook-length control protein FliK [Methylosinus sp. RM1]
MSVAPSNDRVATSSSTDRASGNDSRSKSSDAAQPVSPSLAGIAPPIGAPGADPSSDCGRQSERRFFAETSDRRGSNVDVRSAAHDVGNYVQAPTSVSPAQPDTSNVSAPEPIGTLAIFAPSTQLPTAFAELLVPQARSLLASASPASAPATAAASAAPIVEAQRHVGAPKILTIELEPASLGAVTVKMKLAHSGIDMRISVESPEALHRLDATRDRLVEAMQSSGCTVDSCTIQIGQNVAVGGAAQAASDSGAAFAQSSGTGAGRDEQSVDRQGVGHGGQGGDRRQSASGEANDSTPNGEPRRVAARRGDDVYL